jgi:hypothetical protein
MRSPPRALARLRAVPTAHSRSFAADGHDAVAKGTHLLNSAQLVVFEVVEIVRFPIRESNHFVCS